MRKLKIMTDSICNIDKDLSNKYDIEIIPLTINIEGIDHVDGVTITSEEFLETLKVVKKIPTTSQATYMRFKTAFKRYINEGYDILYISGSSKASGTYQSANLAKEDFKSNNILIYDSENISIGATVQVLKAVELKEKGLNKESIVEELNKLKADNKINLLFYVDTLEYLKRGGRISSAMATIGDTLNIKPFITVKDGLPIKVKSVRGKRKITKTFLEYIKQNFNGGKLIVAHGSNYEEAKEFINIILNEISNIEIIKIIACPVIATHIGYNALGISFLSK